MEARLFFLSLWCGLYAKTLRLIWRRDEWIKKVWVAAVLNSIFWATFAGMLGMLFASYTEKMDETGFYIVWFAIMGLAIGAVTAFRSKEDDTKRMHLLRDNLEWADTGFSAILLASFVMFFIIQAFKIPSGSMRMTFIEGDHLFVNKFIYGIPLPFSDKKIVHFRPVKTNDIVIFRFPAKGKTDPHYGKDFIKRAVALEGQKVQIINKELYVDGVKRDEPFKQHVDPIVFQPLEGFTPAEFSEKWQEGDFAFGVGESVRDNLGPIVVPPGYIFVMGDNRDRSFDSRFWGPLALSAVKGKAWLLYWPGPLPAELSIPKQERGFFSRFKRFRLIR